MAAGVAHGEVLAVRVGRGSGRVLEGRQRKGGVAAPVAGVSGAIGGGRQRRWW